MIYYIIISAIILCIFLIIWAYFSSSHKFSYFLLRINEAETNIEELLKQKKEIIKEIRTIIQEKTKETDFLNNFEQIEALDNHFSIHSFLQDSYVEIQKILSDHEQLLNDQTMAKKLEELEEIDEELTAVIKFYNDITVEYNRLLTVFPSNITRIFFHYKPKEFYSTEKKEIYEILNN